MPNVYLIAAIDDERGIARKGKLPWDLPADRKYFRDHVATGPVIMGQKTYASNKFRPFGHGKNYVLSRESSPLPGIEVIHDVEAFFENLSEDVWVAGGGQMFTAALPYATHLYLTRVTGSYTCDVFFPDFEETFECIQRDPPITENGIAFSYEIWTRKNVV